jgi:hypothetical protein
MSDLQRRSMDRWRTQGYLVGSVEHRKRFPAKGKPRCRVCGYFPMIEISSDLWGVFDLLLIRPVWQGGIGNVALLQVTSSTNHSARRNKILASGEAKLLSVAGVRVGIESWKKKQNHWVSSDEWFHVDDFKIELPTTAAALYEMQRKAKLPDLPKGTTLFQKPEFITEEEIPF